MREMGKGAEQHVSQLAADLHKAVARFDAGLEQVDRRHDVNREAGLAEWVSRTLLLVLRWLGSPAEAAVHFGTGSVWLEGGKSSPPRPAVSRSLGELPVLVAQLLDHLRPVLAIDTLAQLEDRPGIKKKPIDIPARILSCVKVFSRSRATLDLAVYRAVHAIHFVRREHLYRLTHIFPDFTAVGPDGEWQGGGALSGIARDLPVSALWQSPPGASGSLPNLEIPCTHTLEPMKGGRERGLQVCIFTQVGCGDSTDQEDEGQWEGFTARICVSVDSTAKSTYTGLRLTVSSLTPGCELRSLRTTLGEYEEEVWGASEVQVALPPIPPGHQHDLLVLGNMRSVGLVEAVFHLGAAPWTREDHRRLRLCLAETAGVETELLRFAEVGEVDEDGCASVLCAFPDHPKPRMAQGALLDLLSEAADSGLPYRVKYFGAAQPTTPDIGCQLRFRFQASGTPSGDDDMLSLEKSRSVMFSDTTDVGDTVSTEACLAERWGLHSARVREEVFRQNLYTLLERSAAEDAESDPLRWQRELAKTLTSPLYDHPLSELRQTPLVRELLWVALGDETACGDPNERDAIIASLRVQRNVRNEEPLDPSPRCRHCLYLAPASEVLQRMHEARVLINDELQRMYRFLESAGIDVNVKELMAEEEQERSFLLQREDEARAGLSKVHRKLPAPRSGRPIPASSPVVRRSVRREVTLSVERTPVKNMRRPPTGTKEKKKPSVSPSPARAPIWARYAQPAHQQRERTPAKDTSRQLVRTASRSSSRTGRAPSSSARPVTRNRSTSRNSNRGRESSVPRRAGSRSLSPTSPALTALSLSADRSFDSSLRLGGPPRRGRLRDASPALSSIPPSPLTSPPSMSIDPYSRTHTGNTSVTVPVSPSPLRYSPRRGIAPLTRTPNTPPRLGGFKTPPRTPQRSAAPFRTGQRVCVRCGTDMVRRIVLRAGLEWKGALERYVGAPGIVTSVDVTSHTVHIMFDPSSVLTHDPAEAHNPWPYDAVQEESTSPVPSRLPLRLHADPAPAVGRKVTQTRRAAKLASLYSSPAAALVAVVAALSSGAAHPR